MKVQSEVESLFDMNIKFIKTYWKITGIRYEYLRKLSIFENKAIKLKTQLSTLKKCRSTFYESAKSE